MTRERCSTDDELKTAGAGRQVLNDELTAMNARLIDRVRELETTNEVLDALLVGTEVPVLFVDPRLRVRRWTPATETLLRPGGGEPGCPLADLGWRLEDAELVDEVAMVLAGTPVVPREVPGDGGQWFLRRIRPYRSGTGQIDGAIITWTDITARKLTEAAQADRDHALSRLTDALPVLISQVDASLRYRFNNAAYARWFGLDPAEIRGRPVVDVLGEEAFALVRPRMEQALAGSACRFDAWLPYQGAGTRCCQIEYIPDRRDNGTVDGFFVLVIDITERRRNAEEIARLNAENRARAGELRAVFEAAPVGIYIGRDLECRNMDMNRAGAEILRLPEHSNPSLSGPDATALPFRVFHAGRELSTDELPMQVAAREGELVHDFHEELHFADGEVRHLIASAAPLRDETGEVGGCVGILADVTRATRAERRYRETLERLKLHVDKSPVASLEWAADTSLLRWSTAAERVFGWSEVEALRGSLRGLGLFPDDEREPFADMIGALVGGLVEHNQALHLNRRKDGETIWCEWHNSVLRDADGRLVSVLSLALDVSGQQALQTSLRRQAEQLAEADRRKDEFLSMLGHELRNPLAPVRNALDRLALGETDQTTLDWALGVIDRQTHHLERLVHDLLDVARITRGAIELKMARQDLGRLVREALEVVECEARARGHALALDLPPGAVVVRGDATRLVQVLSNVLHNAVKYTDRAGRIAVGLVEEDGVARVTVADDGRGIPPDSIPTLFEPFTQGPRSLARVEGGLGLGLTLVKNLVGLHGGSVALHSDGVGHGTRVTLTFPLDAGPAPETDVGPGAAAGDDAPGEGRRVLIVDDSPDVVEAASELLRALGHEVSGGASGAEALEAVSRVRPELILLDIGLPDIDGIEVARRLAERPERRAFRLVAVSGYGVSSLGEEAALFDAHLLKPVGVADLKRLLE
ncbi:hypothetical protein AY586_00515 [Marichromatium gracile]|uniref:histidine kinase n=2 Tax=Marichromatium gracile TaxID=1048 RepID=A0ABR5VL44_MARGR|nr:hypothetical protein AY586_00515 [Marichromatium gracile]